MIVFPSCCIHLWDDKKGTEDMGQLITILLQLKKDHSFIMHFNNLDIVSGVHH